MSCFWGGCNNCRGNYSNCGCSNNWGCNNKCDCEKEKEKLTEQVPGKAITALPACAMTMTAYSINA